MYIKRVLVLVFLAVSISLSAQEPETVVDLDEIVVTAQGREEKMLEVPITMSSINSNFLELTNTNNLQDLSGFVPGVYFRGHQPHRSTFVIRGLSSDEVSPTAQPRISAYFNNTPISRATMAKTNLFDMERVEVVKGPQGTLFGRGSQIGGINFISKKPTSEFGGFVGAGFGNLGMYETEAVINVPIIPNKLMIRTGGTFFHRDGYVKNETPGGKDPGGFIAGDARFSLRYLPTNNFRIDLVVDYQYDDNDGNPIMHPNENLGGGDLFSFKTKYPDGRDFFNTRYVLGTMLDMNYYFNNGSYISSLTSFYDNKLDSRSNSLGMHIHVLDMTENFTAQQFNQELRYNFTKNRFKGFVGASYWQEDATLDYSLYTNDQYAAYFFLQMTDYMVQPDGNIYPMPAIPNNPQLGPLAGMPLVDRHEEKKITSADNSSFDIFANLDFNITDQLVLTAGLRGTWETLSMTDNAVLLTPDSPSSLGYLTGSYPNLMFSILPEDVKDERTYFSATWRANLKYLINDQATVFAGYSKGRRSPILQPQRDGSITETDPEIVDNFEIGFKYMDKGRFWFDAGLFYYLYNDFQAYAFVDMDYKTVNAGKANNYGAELNMNVTVFDFLDVFGNYAYIHARFADDPDRHTIPANPSFPGSTDIDFSGHRFSLTPDHSFTLGLNAKANITDNIGVMFTPTYSYRGDTYFQDFNVDDMKQDAYGLLDLNLSVRLQNPSLNVSFFCKNIGNKNYLASAGGTGQMFGFQTYVPGVPRTLGMKVKWNF